jgi:hypothetical protein
MTEALCSSETSVLTRATQRNIPEHAILQGLRLFQALDRSPAWAKLLAEYRLLWLDFSHLVKQAGAVSCYTCGCYLVHQFFMITLSAYATLSDVIAGNFDTKLLDNSVIFSASMILAVCEGANTVTLKVSTTLYSIYTVRLASACYSLHIYCSSVFVSPPESCEVWGSAERNRHRQETLTLRVTINKDELMRNQKVLKFR